MTTPPVQPPVPQNPYAQPVPQNPYVQPVPPQAAGAPQWGTGYAQQQYAPPAPAAPGPAHQQPAPPMGYGPNCRFCGSVPAVNVTIRGHQGMIVIMRFLKQHGPFCRRCGIAVHRDMTAKTLWQGWWGYASMLITPITMLINLVARSKINNLPEPIPGAPRAPMNPGKPILQRPAALFLLLPVVALGLLIGVVVLGAQSDPEFAEVGECVYNAGTQDNPNMIVTDCYGSKAEYEIVGKLDDTTHDAGCATYPKYSTSYYEEHGSTKYVLCLAPKS